MFLMRLWQKVVMKSFSSLKNLKTCITKMFLMMVSTISSFYLDLFVFYICAGVETTSIALDGKCNKKEYLWYLRNILSFTGSEAATIGLDEGKHNMQSYVTFIVL